MKTIDFTLVLGLAALAAAGGYRALAQPVKPASPAPALGSVKLPVRAAWSPASRDAAWAETGDAGTVTLRGAEGESVVGLATAVLFEDRGAATAWHAGHDATTAQVGAMLDLRRWLAAGRADSPRYHLHVVALVQGADGTERRSAWIRLRPGDLLAAPLVAELPPRRRVTVRCATLSGQAMPGAYVTVAPAELSAGMIGIALTTDERGEARVGGLPEEGTWVLSTNLGVGPSAEVARATIDLATASTATVEVQLGGRWNFDRVRLSSPFAGVALGIARPPVDDPARGRAWFVSPIAVPGSTSPELWIMRPGLARGPLEVKLELRGYEPERVVVGAAPESEPVRLRPSAAPPERRRSG